MTIKQELNLLLYNCRGNMKKKAPIVNTDNITESKNEVKQVYFDEYYNMNNLKRTVHTFNSIDKLAQEMIEWARDDEGAFKISQFTIMKGIYYKDLERWMAKSEYLRQAYEHTLQILGNRREIGAIKRKYDFAAINPMMFHYDKDWKKMAEWRAKVKEEASGNVAAINVTIEACPESSEVPKKDERRSTSQVKQIQATAISNTNN